MDKLKEYIEKLKTSSFEGWSEDSINGYITALISIEEFCMKVGNISNIQWQDAVKTKPEPYVKVYAKGGFKMEPLADMVTWTGDKWIYVESAEELNWSVTHFVIPG